MPTRRQVLAATAATAASGGVSGCLGAEKNVAGRDQPSRMTLTITTLPADSDPHAIRIVRHLAEHLEAVGIEPRIRTVDDAGLYREILINHDFDAYVGQFPSADPIDPDALYSLLHSSFVAEPGWQNPFGLTDPAIDDLLDRQRRADHEDRRRAVAELQDAVARRQPFTVVAFPDMLTAVHDDRFIGWERTRPATSEGLLELDANAVVGTMTDDEGRDGEPTDEEPANGEDRDGDPTDDRRLRLVTTDSRITTNRNPIAPEHRRYGTFTGLVYDPLVRAIDGEEVPWLARRVVRVDERTVRVEMREAVWHDGEPVTAADAAFTYAFLADTSLGKAETPIPSPRFRGRSTLVDSATAIGDRTLEVRFTDAAAATQRRGLTVPILPEHVWRSRTDLVELPAGITINEMTTEAQVWENPDPVGCGPLRFREAEADERVVFERNPAHAIAAEPESFPERVRGKPAFETLELRVVPSDVAAVQQVGDGLADASTSNLGPDAVPRIGREAAARLVSQRSGAFYHVGYNTRRVPLSNPYFRRVLARLLDKAALVGSAFQGYARPTASPLALSGSWLADELRWTDGDPATPFFESDGEFDAAAAREALREIGYRYDENGALLVPDSAE
ncbi:peptide/nickel transport system substrate-binding protein [Halopenitus malekzadehii]|uniref:Peptide/nickel transport system substrate-binding protein n=2 Tax=Halopenitus malekzadehii TaxID=1267564 RepID=A0A1H6JCV0_9EURY|nr:ABC transporter substrate-binding protein [Halopenitus malekzadehii]SEH56837.1 peptide/nickel transport system substrate-binding protein [Halopenitus malekzadehii]